MLNVFHSTGFVSFIPILHSYYISDYLWTAWRRSLYCPSQGLWTIWSPFNARPPQKFPRGHSRDALTACGEFFFFSIGWIPCPHPHRFCRALSAWALYEDQQQWTSVHRSIYVANVQMKAPWTKNPKYLQPMCLLQALPKSVEVCSMRHLIIQSTWIHSHPEWFILVDWIHLTGWSGRRSTSATGKFVFWIWNVLNWHKMSSVQYEAPLHRLIKLTRTEIKRNSTPNDLYASISYHSYMTKLIQSCRVQPKSAHRDCDGRQLPTADLIQCHLKNPFRCLFVSSTVHLTLCLHHKFR